MIIATYAKFYFDLTLILKGDLSDQGQDLELTQVYFDPSGLDTKERRRIEVSHRVTVMYMWDRSRPAFVYGHCVGGGGGKANMG